MVKNGPVARPSLPLINHDDVIATALETIDQEGLEALTIRRLGEKLGIHGASLYHHFRGKESILHGVRMRIMRDARITGRPIEDESWQECIRRVTLAYHGALLLHPNAAPLMAPSNLLRPYSLLIRDHVAAKLLAEGVPRSLAFAIIDSVETLAYASALLNPSRQRPQDRLPVRASDNVPSLSRSLRHAPRTSAKLFRIQLDALLTGWTALVDASVE